MFTTALTFQAEFEKQIAKGFWQVADLEVMVARENWFDPDDPVRSALLLRLLLASTAK